MEALAQVGAVAILSLPENKGKLAFFGGIKNARFKRQVVPGDVLELRWSILLEKDFNEVYTKFKLHFYRAVFGRFKRREATLTTVETFCMEIILALGEPTVNEFSNFVGISPPNAAYKINSLVQKGYVEKRQSQEDKREYHLVATQKYLDYYNISYHYLNTVMSRIRARFSPEDVAKLEGMLEIISRELMPEIPLGDQIHQAEQA